MRTLDRNNRISLGSKNFLELALVPSSHHHIGTTNHEKEVGGGVKGPKQPAKQTPEGTLESKEVWNPVLCSSDR